MKNRVEEKKMEKEKAFVSVLEEIKKKTGTEIAHCMVFPFYRL